MRRHSFGTTIVSQGKCIYLRGMKKTKEGVNKLDFTVMSKFIYFLINSIIILLFILVNLTWKSCSLQYAKCISFWNGLIYGKNYFENIALIYLTFFYKVILLLKAYTYDVIGWVSKRAHLVKLKLSSIGLKYFSIWWSNTSVNRKIK